MAVKNLAMSKERCGLCPRPVGGHPEALGVSCLGASLFPWGLWFAAWWSSVIGVGLLVSWGPEMRPIIGWPAMPACQSPSEDWTLRPREASPPGTTPRVCSPPLPGGVLCPPWGEGGRSPAPGTFLDSTCGSLPLADFNMHPLVIINHSREYNSVQGLLSLLSKLSKLGGLWEPWTSQLASEEVSGSPGLHSWRQKRSRGALDFTVGVRRGGGLGEPWTSQLASEEGVVSGSPGLHSWRQKRGWSRGALDFTVGIRRGGGLGEPWTSQLASEEGVVSGSSGLHSWCQKRSRGALPKLSAVCFRGCNPVFLGGPCDGGVSGPQSTLGGIVFCRRSVCAGLSCPHRVVLHLSLLDTRGFQWCRNH
ncbi:uncharacterized protein LOC103678444 [Ursus maritimus]|uniref:Uncharacterized protein LOC103678444 n=1 Tax=Ursus maritimus TaxID=29073 RepID=A0A384DG96_URSMA|nr:uncharacterized protein LOC103678444 [Ursus maritimus]